MNGIPGLAVIPDKFDRLQEVRTSDFPLSTDCVSFGVQVVVQRTRHAPGGKDYMTSQVRVNLSREDATKLLRELPAALERAAAKSRQTTKEA